MPPSAPTPPQHRRAPRRRPPASRLRKLDAHHRVVRRRLFDLLLEAIHRHHPVNQLFKTYIVGSRLGVSHQRASDLFAGRLHLFNSETLIAMLQRYGVKIGITVVEQRRIGIFDDPGPH